MNRKYLSRGKKKGYRKILVALGAVLILATFSIVTSEPLVHHTQSETTIASSLRVNDLQETIHKLYKMAGKQVEYKLGGINVNAQVSKVDEHSVHVNFYTVYDNTTMHSTSTITNNTGKYSVEATTDQVPYTQMKNVVIWDPGGTYYYYVQGDSGTGSQTWTYWYAPGGTWSSSSDAYPNSGTFFVTWNGPLIAFFFGIPSGFVGFNWEASNGAGWSYNSQLFEPHSGSATLQGYYGTSTTVSVTVGWTYATGSF